LECRAVAGRWFRAGGWCWGNSHIFCNTRCNNFIEFLQYSTPIRILLLQNPCFLKRF
jgi:hypothetical protein